MKKKVLLILALGCAILMTACRTSLPNEATGSAEGEAFKLLTATITEENGDLLTVTPVEGSWELSAADAIYAHKDWADESIRSLLMAGTRVVIQYDGRIMETYPAQIDGEKMWIESIR